eukprot:TRINITY_DN26175_c0_g1_i1.p1 TRINITY_DN26175_c0_g1~~TRINITY_DN26175_c0_g1_i1.p1  ORF type:complete len:217 (+),score=11.02 TRINITY_DN26175_c0_g1_i1:46-696(+)
MKAFPFPTRNVSKVLCVLRNYVAHAKELNNPLPEKPTFFLKPPSAITTGGKIIIPPTSTDVHHEVELGVVIGKPGKNILEADALKHVAGYTIALDMTARDIQAVAKEKGLPWSEAKGYDTFCPVGEYLPAELINDPQLLEIFLSVNNQDVQRASTSLMIFPIARQIAHASRIMSLQEGDLLLTGTPAGVGQIKPGDKLVAGITGLTTMECVVEKAE